MLDDPGGSLNRKIAALSPTAFGSTNVGATAGTNQERHRALAGRKAYIITASTKEALDQAEAERAHLRQIVQRPYKKLDKVARFLPDMVDRFKMLVNDLATVTQFQVDKARGMLRELVGGRILLYPAADRADRYLVAELTGDYAGLLRLVCGPKLNLTTVDP